MRQPHVPPYCAFGGVGCLKGDPQKTHGVQPIWSAKQKGSDIYLAHLLSRHPTSASPLSAELFSKRAPRHGRRETLPLQCQIRLQTCTQKVPIQRAKIRRMRIPSSFSSPAGSCDVWEKDVGSTVQVAQTASAELGWINENKRRQSKNQRLTGYQGKVSEQFPQVHDSTCFVNH